MTGTVYTSGQVPQTACTVCGHTMDVHGVGHLTLTNGQQVMTVVCLRCPNHHCLTTVVAPVSEGAAR